MELSEVNTCGRVAAEAGCSQAVLQDLLDREGAAQERAYAMSAADLAKFVVDRATRSAIEAVTSCAVDGSPCWRLFFDNGLAHAIAEDEDLENLFLGKLCGGPGLPYSAEIIDAYFARLPAEHIEKMLQPTALRRKGHPATLAFHGASFMTPAGVYMLQILKVFVKYGLHSLEIVANRCYTDVERAFCLNHEKFIPLVVQGLERVPEELLIAVVKRSSQGPNVVHLLINKCGVPIDQFAKANVLDAAQPSVRQFIVAYQARGYREPERKISRVDEDDFRATSQLCAAAAAELSAEDVASGDQAIELSEPVRRRGPGRTAIEVGLDAEVAARRRVKKNLKDSAAPKATSVS